MTEGWRRQNGYHYSESGYAKTPPPQLPTHIYVRQDQVTLEYAPPEYTVLSLYNDTIHQVVLKSDLTSTGAIDSSGLGFLKFVRDDSCYLRVTEWYSWKEGKLVKVRTEETFHPKFYSGKVLPCGSYPSFMSGIEEGYCCNP